MTINNYRKELGYVLEDSFTSRTNPGTFDASTIPVPDLEDLPEPSHVIRKLEIQVKGVSDVEYSELIDSIWYKLINGIPTPTLRIDRLPAKDDSQDMMCYECFPLRDCKTLKKEYLLLNERILVDNFLLISCEGFRCKRVEWTNDVFPEDFIE